MPVGLDEPALLYLLSESPIALKQRLTAIPQWLDDMIQAYADVGDNSQAAALEVEGEGKAGMLDIVAPLIRRGADRLLREAERITRAHQSVPFDPASVCGMFMPRLSGQLFQLLSRTIALELNVARLQGSLRGDLPKDRFEDFVRTDSQPEAALVLLEEYSVLARLAAELVERWVNVTVEFLDRLSADWDCINAQFGDEFPSGGPGLLIGVSEGAGDTHRSGRAVAVATFSGGFRLVYKPRSLAVEAHFQELLAWLNERGDHPPLPRLRILERNCYGWVQFVGSTGCEDMGAIERFYQRQGCYLALLHVLEATDFHFENVIAVGESPVLIDLESLFHPQLAGAAGNGQAGPPDNPRALLSVGLLPLPRAMAADVAGLDLSGLGSPAGQVTARAVSQWDGIETDQMRIVRKPLTLNASQNLPSINGQDIPATDYVDSLVAGFTSVYRTLLRHRAELLAEDGPLQRFASDEVRVILRLPRLTRFCSMTACTPTCSAMPWTGIVYWTASGSR